MAEYTKKLKTIDIYLYGLDGVITVKDTADKNHATTMLNAFLNYETMILEAAEGQTDAIPYHAVRYIAVTSTDSDALSRDPYCGVVGGGSDPIGDLGLK